MSNIEVKHEIDPLLEKNKDNLIFNGKKFDLDAFRDIFPSVESKYPILMYWDDMLQHTAIGLSEIIAEKYNLNFSFNFHDYMNRESFPLGIDYVKDLYRDISPFDIDKIYKENYKEILFRSPTTELFTKLHSFRTLASTITIAFRFNISDLNDLIESIKDESNFVPIKNIDYVVLNSEKEEEKYLISMKPKIIFCPDMGFYYYTILKNEIYNKTLVSPIIHNGVNPYILAIYAEKFMDSPDGGPNKCELLFLTEGIDKK